jgi:hypothetical protein
MNCQNRNTPNIDAAHFYSNRGGKVVHSTPSVRPSPQKPDWNRLRKVSMLLALTLLLCSTTIAFQGGGGETTKKKDNPKKNSETKPSAGESTKSKPIPKKTSETKTDNITTATIDLSNRTIVAMLESSWNYYVREPISLGPTYFGNTTSFGRYGESAYALELMSSYSRYQALVTKGLIRLAELSLDDAPTTLNGRSPEIKWAATVSLTPAGAKLGTLDNKKSTVTFVLGTYHVEKIISNTIVETSEGNYRLVEGTHVLDVVPEFADVWAELGWRTYRERKFRVIFQYNTTDALYKHTGKAWRVATASNGRFSAEDRGPRNGRFESANVPPTLDQLRVKRR